MRVATNFIYVADISYTPQNVFDGFPTVSYSGMKVLHPDYQRADMHLAFCFPFNNPPREDIFHRYKKDLKRFRLLQEFYPITVGKKLANSISGSEKLQPIKVEVDLSRVAIHGFAGYAIIRNAFETLEKAAIDNKISSNIITTARNSVNKTPPLTVKIDTVPHSNRCILSFIPPTKSTYLTLATPWPDEVVEDIVNSTKGEVQWFAPYMDSRPLMARITFPGKDQTGVDVFSTYNHLLAVSNIVCDNIKVTVATSQYILLNFLYEAHIQRNNSSLQNLYIQYYTGTLDLLEAGGILISALREEGSGPKVAESIYRNFVESSPFGLPILTIGDLNHDSSYLIRLSQSAQKIGEKIATANVPTRYYPSGKHVPGKHPPFDYESNIAFQRGGQKIKK